MAAWPVPGLDDAKADKVRTQLQDRLVALIDLQLTLKHIHWNVVGPNFIGVHEMLDPQVEKVRGFTDDTAERIATLGGEPVGTPGHVASTRRWEEYDLKRADVTVHLKKLDAVYSGVIADHREALREFEELDLVSHDMLIEQTEALEMFQWFVRAHLTNADGDLPT